MVATALRPLPPALAEYIICHSLFLDLESLFYINDNFPIFGVPSTQPKQTDDIKKFLKMAYTKEARYIKMKKCKDSVKFKLRLSRYLWTLTEKNPVKIKKIKQSLPHGLEKTEIGNIPFGTN
eukprot:jgi/Bigna1/86073/estExt_fgenesh1_pg.C_80021